MANMFKLDPQGYLLLGPVQVQDGVPDGWMMWSVDPDPPSELPYVRLRAGVWEYSAELPEPGLPPVPSKISNLQARACLRMRNIFQDVEDVINTLAVGDPGNDIEPQPAMLDYWQFASDFHRNHYGIAIIAFLMGWSSDYVDDMYREAITYY